jgi:hypothetical protein
MQEWIEPAFLGALTLASLVLAVVLLRTRATTSRDLRSAHAESASLRAQLEDLDRRLTHAPPRAHPDPEFVITHLGETGPATAPAVAPATAPAVAPVGAPVVGVDAVERVDSALFADLVLRETVVKAASLTHGLRRALAPEVRNRIRFEMGREIKRARKQRRADLKAARRHPAPAQPTVGETA